MDTKDNFNTISFDNVNQMQLTAIIAEYAIKNNALLQTIIAHLETHTEKKEEFDLQGFYDSYHASEMASFLSRISKG